MSLRACLDFCVASLYPMIGGVGNINEHCLFFLIIYQCLRSILQSHLRAVLYLVTNTKGGLFDLVLFTNRSCLLIDFVSNTM